MKLLNYQIKHAENIKKSIQKHSRAIDASETGTGKTYVSIFVCNNLKLTPFVICPKSVKNTWTTLLNQSGYKENEYYVTNYESLRTSNNLVAFDKEKKEYFWNFEANNEFKDIKKFLFIYDEAHRCKNINSINSQILLSLCDHDIKILLLSATLTDKIEYFIPFGKVLKFYKSINDGLVWMTQLNNSPVLINKKIFNEYGSRMKIEDTVNIFKKNKIICNSVFIANHHEIEQKYNKIYKLMENSKKEKQRLKEIIIDTNTYTKPNINEINTNTININEPIINIANINGNCEPIETNKRLLQNIKINNDDDIDKNKPQHLKEIMSLRQDIELLKVDSICDMTKKYLSQNKSVVIFVNFTNTTVELKKKLNTNCVVWGLQKIEERNKSINDFCSDLSRIIICNIKAGSEGLSLHDTKGNYPRVSLICPTWSAQELLQALGRIHRATGKSDCIQEIIYCKNTVEENMSVVIQNKINNIKLFNDGKINLKNDNLEVLLKNAFKQRMKEEEKKLYLFETMDIEKIQNNIDKLESQIKHMKMILKNNINNDQKNEWNYKLDVLNSEMDFYCTQLNLLINRQIEQST